MGIFISKISIEETFNLGNYENVKLGLEVIQSVASDGTYEEAGEMVKEGVKTLFRAFDYHHATLKARASAKAKPNTVIQARVGSVDKGET